MPRSVLVFALVLAVTLGACAPQAPDPVSAVRVERSHSLPLAPPPTVFTIVPASRAQSADPAFQVAANLVAARLERLGHRRVTGDGTARAAWQVSLDTAISGGAAGSGLTYGFGWGQPPLRVLSGGQESTATPPPSGPLEKRLSITVTADKRTVYQGRAVLYDESRDLIAALAPLTARLLAEFPGPVGAQGGTP